MKTTNSKILIALFATLSSLNAAELIAVSAVSETGGPEYGEMTYTSGDPVRKINISKTCDIRFATSSGQCRDRNVPTPQVLRSTVFVIIPGSQSNEAKCVPTLSDRVGHVGQCQSSDVSEQSPCGAVQVHRHPMARSLLSATPRQNPAKVLLARSSIRHLNRPPAPWTNLRL